MKADLTRSTFDRAKHYSSVRMQQGRVQLDADWNEQQDIVVHLERTETIDVIGSCGAPDHLQSEAKHFKVSANPGAKDFTVAPGRIYVSGILCENESATKASDQPDLPKDAALAQMTTGPAKKLSELASGTFVAYLDVWQRHITALEDGGIRETALNGPDTTTRLKTVWQVKLLEVAPGSTCVGVPNLQAWKDLTADTSGTMTAKTDAAQSGTDPCAITAEGGYRGLENQLYRVEVHQGGPRASATFKWSRDNGSVVTRIKSVDVANKRLTVEDTGKDVVLGFAPNQWVELVDDDMELLGVSGQLAQIASVNAGTRTIVLNQTPAPLNQTRNAKLRRWDQTGVGATTSGVAMAASVVALEDGIGALFSDGASRYRPGDHWLVPARSSRAEIEWPRDPTDATVTLPKPRDGVRHYYCPLAVLTLGAGEFTLAGDCRKLFPPLTALASFFYVGGDGQEARPAHQVPQPLQVGVADTQGPIVGANVRFRVLVGTGTISFGATTGNDITVPTGVDGIAQCDWRLDPTTPSQRVEATLVETSYTALNLPVHFNANLSIADEVAYRVPTCDTIVPGVLTVMQQLKNQVANWPPQDPAGVTTVKDILEALLCKLDARKLPYDPTATRLRWEDITETAGAFPNTVQEALDDLAKFLESSDITYDPACKGVKGTVLARLGVPDNKSKVADFLDALLCNLNASHIPIDRSNPSVCPALRPAGVETVQQALEAICTESHFKVTSGTVVFAMPAGASRASTLISHGHGTAHVTISLAFATPRVINTPSVVFQGTAFEELELLTLGTFLNPQTPDRFQIFVRDRRSSGAPARPVEVRWWAIPANDERAPAGLAVLPNHLLEAVVVDMVRSQPNFTPTPEVAATLGITLPELNTVMTGLRTNNQLVLRAGRFFLPDH
jgi:hypothetical protein